MRVVSSRFLFVFTKELGRDKDELAVQGQGWSRQAEGGCPCGAMVEAVRLPGHQ